MSKRIKNYIPTLRQNRLKIQRTVILLGSETLHGENEHRCKIRAMTRLFPDTPEIQDRQYEYHHAQIL
jgi:hypothetical protein